MKNFFKLLVVAVATILVSCNQVEFAGDCGKVTLVSKTTKQGKLYGIKSPDKKIAIYPQFSYFEPGFDDYTIYFSNDRKEWYLFDWWGREILTDRTSRGVDGKKELGFTPVPINKKESGERSTYFGNLFRDGEYFLFKLTGGGVYALFDKSYQYIYGPYEDFFAGSSGFSYKQNNKWGARTELNKEQEIFPAEYEEIIEAVTRTSDGWFGYKVTYVWFARKGKEWTSCQIGKDGIVKPVSVNVRLLNRVRNMQIQDGFRARKDIVSTELIPGQRAGTKETSVAFL